MTSADRLKQDIRISLERGPLPTKMLVIELARRCRSNGRKVYGPDEIISALSELCFAGTIEHFSDNWEIFYRLRKN